MVALFLVFVISGTIAALRRSLAGTRKASHDSLAGGFNVLKSGKMCLRYLLEGPTDVTA
ncbi:hypothetical protein AGR1A_Lc60192 [Agrobacterium fabacearum CFBP 5771]|nr:hypothetical protein AGR1A_Lc60192 [Agrobacterium fabacearum CFBP 5771]